jgi:hypothetical protein
VAGDCRCQDGRTVTNDPPWRDEREDRRQKTEDRRQKTEDRRQETGVRRQKVGSE